MNKEFPQPTGEVFENENILRRLINQSSIDGVAVTKLDPELSDSTAQTLTTLMKNSWTPEVNLITREYSVPDKEYGFESAPRPMNSGDHTAFVVKAGSGIIEAMGGKSYALRAELSPGTVVLFGGDIKRTPLFKLTDRKGLVLVWVEKESADLSRSAGFEQALDVGAVLRGINPANRAKEQLRMQKTFDRIIRRRDIAR